MSAGRAGRETGIFDRETAGDAGVTAGGASG
jgi:hypothetical protein